MAKKAGKNESIRAKSIDMQMTDISWLNTDAQLAMKQYYLDKFGFYYDGELKNA